MKILDFHESDDFESDGYDSYVDDSENSHERKVGPNSFLIKAVAALIAVTGIGYAANLALSSGSSLEFGQGFRTVAACDTDGITVIPLAGYVNEAGTGKFTLDSIILENISANCFGDRFIVQVYGDTGTALSVSESATSVGVYTQFDAGSFLYQDSATVVSVNSGYTDFEVLTDLTTNEATTGLNSVQIVFDPDRTISFANASDVRKITLLTVQP